MINVTILTDPYISAVPYWRIFRPMLKVMNGLYFGTFRFKVQRKNLTYVDAAEANVIIWPRPGEYPELIEFVEKAKELGAKIIIDLDDDTLDLPVNHSLYWSYESRRKNIQKAFSLADHVWYSTPYLLEKYGGGEVIPNAIMPQDIPEGPAPDRGITMWRGREIQVHDLNTEGIKHYKEVLNGSRVMCFLGYVPPISHHGAKVAPAFGPKDFEKAVEDSQVSGPIVLTIPGKDDTDKYIAALRAFQFNAIWKPLANEPFNNAKSNIAWLESVMSGGYCVTNFASKPGWEFAWPKMLKYDAACELWQASKDHALKHYNLVNTAHMRAASIFRLLGITVKK